MGWFDKLFGKPNGGKTVTQTPSIEPDPQAYSQIPPPAPYRPAIYYPADLPQGRTAEQKYWARDIGNESDKPPVSRRRYAADTEYLRDLSTAAQDGIGHTTDVYGSSSQRQADPRWDGTSNTGKRPYEQISNPDKFTYFRPYDQTVARGWNADRRGREYSDVLPTGTRQGNYAVRTWRLTARQDPTSGETYDRTPAAASSRVTEYNAGSTIRRNFRK